MTLQCHVKNMKGEIMRKYEELTGKKFGRWTVLRRDYSKSQSAWWCRCDCGTERGVFTSLLTSGNSKSCGCLRDEMLKARGSEIFRTNLYYRYRTMISLEKKRGYEVCEEWKNYENFREWALSHGYADDMVLRRASKKKGFCPDNCYYTQKKQKDTLE